MQYKKTQEYLHTLFSWFLNDYINHNDEWKERYHKLSVTKLNKLTKKTKDKYLFIIFKILDVLSEENGYYETTKRKRDTKKGSD